MQHSLGLLSLEVGRATDVVVADEWTRRGWIERLLIAAMPQDGIETLVADCASRERSFGSGFHTCGRIALAQADDAEAGAVAHLGMWEGLQDFLYNLGSAGTYRAGPGDHARRWPVQVRSVGGRTMLGAGHCRVGLAGEHVGGDPLPLVEDFNRRWRSAHFYRPPHQLIGHAVEAPLEQNVIVDVQRGLRPHGEIKALGGQRPQHRLIHFEEQAAA